LDGVGSSAALSELDNASVIGPTIPPSASNNFVTDEYPTLWIASILCQIGLDSNIWPKVESPLYRRDFFLLIELRPNCHSIKTDQI
jgi:hypothetical protein